MTDRATPRTRIRVVVADDHPVVLAGIKAMLQSAPEIDLVGEAGDGAGALRLVAAERPDVAVLDISMPEINGLDLARRIAVEAPGVKVITLTVHEDRAYVQQLLDAGARGYLLKRSAAEDLVRAVRAVAEGGLYLDPSVAGKALAETAATEKAAAADAVLSPREADVLRFTAQGFSNKEIAIRLEVGVKTVETYKARASDKLGLRSRAEIVRYGAVKGWLAGLAEGT
ncbi:response regulator transcription factor [Lichenibacterium minor]|jgi:DNA-binding NarL/FixJ family response regulator|uniref:Response regulator transcription factor n=1 Tax=Lichenibacterium minor TaxID=2316528 RepID=A0A4Q2U3L5_9HYPH|nr:response regulator transcription factor [Lichenibacterium minor]RYC29477.1 response regulator transcription factor [Lichenibacterium minor]